VDLLDAIRDPQHPEREEMLEWLGEEFDPERFDADAVNAILAPTSRTRAA
jgi:Plasmid pRiA4b ORF-3-like protein